MLDSMQRRGPDAGGVFVQNGIGLDHRRLSIIDLNPTSQQPMIDSELGLAVVFNGCIYNYKELRRTLIDKGFRFFSDGDTEVILKAYAAWGTRCVERFYGMFAFALWERDSGRVVLARDRLGIKPLYLADVAGSLRFASTLPALLAASGIDTSIDPVALHHYMSWHAVVPPPRTILNGIRKLPPASILQVEPDGSRHLETYWEFATEHHRIRVDARELLHALPDTIAEMPEPMMSHDCVAFFLLAREVGRHVKVVQSGQGADEVFGGYHWYSALQNSNDLVEDYTRVYFDRDHGEMGEALTPDLVGGDHSRAFIEEFFDTCRGRRPIDKVLQLDTEIMLVDDPVKRVDNMTMAWGLEARVPFLDHEVVELAARLPAALKVDGAAGKYILKEAARGIVPAEVIDRPKGYFPVPALKYLRGPVLDFVRTTLEEPQARERGLFNPGYVERLLDDPEGELTPKGHSKLWQVAVLESWLQAHRI